MDFNIKHIPIPLTKEELYDERLFEKNEFVFTPDNPLSEFGERPKQIELLKKWQEEEIKLNKDLIVYSKDLFERCLKAFPENLELLEDKEMKFSCDPMYGFRNIGLGLIWNEDEDHYGMARRPEFMHDDLRFYTEDCYYPFPPNRYDLLMENFILANKVLREGDLKMSSFHIGYKSLPKFESFGELEMYLSIRGF